VHGCGEANTKGIRTITRQSGIYGGAVGRLPNAPKSSPGVDRIKYPMKLTQRRCMWQCNYEDEGVAMHLRDTSKDQCNMHKIALL
jgi:hypothetical protein